MPHPHSRPALVHRSQLGFEVIEAENGQQCLEVFEREGKSLSCILMDLHMPVMDGWVATKQVRALETRDAALTGPETVAAHLPIVACTATALEQVRQGKSTISLWSVCLLDSGSCHPPLLIPRHYTVRLTAPPPRPPSPSACPFPYRRSRALHQQLTESGETVVCKALSSGMDACVVRRTQCLRQYMEHNCAAACVVSGARFKLRFV